MNPSSFQFDPAVLSEIRAGIARVTHTTPLLPSNSVPGLHFKTENFQKTGSFKVRPAYAQLIRLTPAQCEAGVVTSSSGNFAQGAAWAAGLLGIRLKVVMMKTSNPLKIANAQALGAEIVLCEDRFEARQETVSRIEKGEGRTPIHPYNHPDAVLGNVTLGLEILEQFPDASDILVPVSGGGLLSGILIAVQHLRARTRVWGIQAEGSNATYLSLKEGRPISIDRARTIADGLTVTQPGSLTFPIIRQLAAGVLQVREQSILAACKQLLLQEKLLVEPSGAVTLAAVLEGQVPARSAVCVLSGGNISPAILNSICS